MANFQKYFYDHVLKYEVGYVADDNGHGQQKWGVVAKWWLPRAGLDLNNDGQINADDIQYLTKAQAAAYTKKYYWDYFKADQIKNQSVAEFIVDFGFVFGVGKAAKICRKILGKSPRTDGFTSQDVREINTKNETKLFNTLKTARQSEAESQTKNQKFWKGWSKRFNNIQFIPNTAGKIAIGTVVALGLGLDYLVRRDRSVVSKFIDEL